MAVLKGVSGNVKIATNAVAEITAWSLDGPAYEMIEWVAFGASGKSRSPSFYDWTGSFTGKFDKTDTNGHVALRTAALAGTVVALRLYVDGTNYWSGNAYITPSYSASADGLVEASYSFAGDGALAWN
jgi:hypothetical protein